MLEDLRHTVHSIRAPFACGGTFVPEQPVTICFPDKTQIPVMRAKEIYEQEQLLKLLVECCGAAPLVFVRSKPLVAVHPYLSRQWLFLGSLA